MRINHNIAALNTYRQLNGASSAQAKSMEKLSSGLRINKAGDDAAGLAISEKMRGQIRGLEQAQTNAQDGISMIQTAEGALNETHSILQRMRELATQASNDTNTETDRGEIQKEINQLTSEINRIGNTTEFNTQKLLKGNVTGEIGGITNTQGQANITAEAAVWNTGAITPVGDSSSGTFTFNGVTITVNTGGASNASVTADGAVSIGIENSATADTVAQAIIDAANAYKADTTNAGSQLDNFTFGGNGSGLTITGTTADGASNNDLVITGTIGITNDDVQTPGVTGQSPVQGSTEFTITNALGAGDTLTVAGQTITVYENDDELAAANGGNGDSYGISLEQAKTAADQASAIAAMTFSGRTAEATGSTISIEQDVAGTGDVTGPVIGNINGKDFSASFQVGANEGQSMSIEIEDMRAKALGISGEMGAAAGTGSFTEDNTVTDGTNNTEKEAALDVSNHKNAAAAITVINKAIESVSSQRSELGAYQNRLDHTINNLGTSAENLTAAESRIRDVDMAKEMMEQTKASILSQASQAMLAQANQMPQGVLQLLR